MTVDYRNDEDLIWYAIDLDRTLAESVWPDAGIGDPIEPNVKKLLELVGAGYKIVIHTSRSWTDYEMIELWLKSHGIPFNGIVCGKLLAARYVDDRNVSIHDESWLPN